MGTTHTTKVVVGIAVLIAIAAFASGYYLKSTKNDEAVSSASPTPSVSVVPTTTTAYKPRSYTVRLTSTGLSPASLNIRPGDTVTLFNNTDRTFWPASNPHPTHTGCPGFDAKRGLSNGESYTLTFSRVKTCGYHNHLDPANTSTRGTITVR